MRFLLLDLMTLLTDHYRDSSMQPEARMSEVEVSGLQGELSSLLGPRGLELHPFLVGWYNQQVGDKFHLLHPADTLAFVVISQPCMFEQAFLPFLACSKLDSIHDPIDQCMLEQFSLVTSLHPDTESLHDFQLGPTRRPRVLVQTAGHVAGAARFYQPQDMEQLDTEGRKLFPVSHHPVWGGWFALRGVIVFRGVRAELGRREPKDELTAEQAAELVKRYNGNWQDWRWRDVGREAGAKYSDVQINYFETPPAERRPVIDALVAAVARKTE